MPLLGHAAVATSATRRCATAAPSVARWPTPTRPPTCRRRCWPSAPRTSPRARTATREIAAGDFYQGFLESALAPDELLTEIRVPKMAGAGWSLPEVQPAGPGLGHRRRGGRGATTATAGVALVNMGSTPILAQAVVGRAGRRGVGRRGGRAGRRRRRAAGRPQRQRRVPRPPGQGARAASAGGSQRLARLPATTRSSSARGPTACRLRSPWPRPAAPCSSSRAERPSAGAPARPR